MPKYAHHTFEGGGIAIWHITESAETLYAMLGMQRYDAALNAMHHEERRTEWLAVRVLLTEVLGRDKEIAYHSTGRPYLTDGSFCISISHTKGYDESKQEMDCGSSSQCMRTSSYGKCGSSRPLFEQQTGRRRV